MSDRQHIGDCWTQQERDAERVDERVPDFPDPRENIETEAFLVSHTKDSCRCWGLRKIVTHATWDQVVAFATAILAADAEWRESNAQRETLTK